MNRVTGIIRRGRKLIDLPIKFVVGPAIQELFFGSYFGAVVARRAPLQKQTASRNV
jgi:hypothetical protein